MIQEGAVEGFRPPIPIAADLGAQETGRRRSERQAPGFAHAFQQPGVILEQEKILAAAVDSLESGIDHPDDQFHFMKLDDYEQLSLTAEAIGEDKAQFLKDGLEVEMLFDAETPVIVELPNFVELTVVTTNPGVKGDTVSGGSKPATLETGAVVQVPLFIEEGERLKIDTRKGAYVSRV